jgi:hypothetical protein
MVLDRVLEITVKITAKEMVLSTVVVEMVTVVVMELVIPNGK